MKKAIVVLSGVALSMSLLFASDALAVEKMDEPVVIVEENGWQVVQDNDPNTSTIIATVTSGDTDGDGYVLATNKYDADDIVAINKEDLEVDDEVAITLVQITFEQDDVVKVVKQ